ncbi:polysaccharide biosynthesis protein [Serratia fonticola]|uniref:lipopolysaccharide biosynthesis protein n=1 Tax=Serratia fonticola TaxID=47917 RepID=UPI0015C68346|nr:oligosaccharide flippase family protein [Serratia fonticola]MBC3380908.1 polysaccharide biosynthesis protein [Serratia fonticola]NYA40107.1 polysaccharide biosynthesis protein [Serratia fonticola]
MNSRRVLTFAVGPIGSSALGLLTLPIITWLFTPDDVGRISMLNIAISFCTLLFSLGLDQSYVREYHNEPSKPMLLKSVISPGLIVLFITCTVLVLFQINLSELLFDYKSIYVSVVTVLILFICFIIRFLSLILRMQERGMAYSFSQLIPKLMILAVIGICYFVFNEHTFIQLLSSNFIGYFVVLILLLILTRADCLAALSSSIDLKKIRPMLSFGYPLILGGLAFWGLTAIDRIFIKNYAGFDQLAIFSVAVSLAGVASILQSVFSTIWSPIVYKLERTEDGGLAVVNKVSNYMLIAVVILFCLCGLLSWVSDYFLPVSYYEVKYLLVSCLGYPLLFTLSEATVVGIGLSRKTGYSMLASLVAFLVNIAGNYILVPKFGAAGAAVSTCFSFWIFLILRTEFSIIIWKKISRLEIYIFTFLCVLGASFSALAGKLFEKELLVFWAALLFAIIARNYKLLTFDLRSYYYSASHKKRS